MPDIYRRNMQFPFWLSPRGMGADCHRTWEALLLGRVPVLRRDANTVPGRADGLFEEGDVNPYMIADLPVMFVNQWADVTVDRLREFWSEMLRKRQQGAYRFEKLTEAYWYAITAIFRHDFTNDF